MLETLKIKNVAVIDSAEIQFGKGLNVLSGETGAGKSIVLESIALILGSRASVELIRTGCDEAVVEGLFDLTELPWMQKRLEQAGFPCEDKSLLIKRTVHRAGKHRISVNGELATLGALQALGEGLIDLCSQNEHQSLVKPSRQLELLDRYGSLLEARDQFKAGWAAFEAVRTELEGLQAAHQERSRRTDFLRFQIAELEKAELRAGEEAELAQQKQLLQSAETRVQHASSVLSVLEDEERGALEASRACLSKLKNLVQLDPAASPTLEALERSLAEAEEVVMSLHRYLGQIDANPELLEQVQERLSLIAELRRKYGGTVEEMLGTLEQLQGELGSLDQMESQTDTLQSELVKRQAELQKQGAHLSKGRVKAAKVLSDSVTGEIRDLRMGDAEFWAEVTPKAEFSEWTSSGADQIQFVVRTNAGEASRPVGKIASGGELSRLMLAIRRVISDRGGIGVYLFDEIDAGIGGQTAFQVGKKLKSVAKYNQVICITHLPQVASFATHHWVVRKTSTGGAAAKKRTQTEVVELSTSRDRQEELARMLGGPELTPKSLGNAAELLELAGR